MQLGALAALVRETVEAQALLPAGPVMRVFAGERGTRRVALEEYVGWLEILENAFPLRSELIERLTLLYHPSRFSPILNLDPARSVLPDGLAPSVYDTWESMLHVGYVEVPVPGGRAAVRITAFWPTLSPPRWVSSDALFYWHGLSLIGYTSWIGGLQDVVEEWLRRRQVDATSPADETGANIPADAGVWLQRALSQRLPREDLRGAIDAVVISSWMEQDPNLPLADMLRDYYSLGPHPPAARHAGRRLELFVGTEPMLLWNGVSRTRASLEELFTAENVAWWALWNVRNPAIDPFARTGSALRPWFAAAMDNLASALVTVLLHDGDEQRTLPSWPAQPDPLYGGWDLRRGDDDATLTYAGQARPGDPGGHVAQLSADLCTGDIAIPPGLGFTGRRDVPDSVFGDQLALLVREFQIEASQRWMWARSAARWERQDAFRRYRGRITGRVDRDTRDAIRLWLNRPDFAVANRTDRPPELQASCGQLQVANGLTVFHADPGDHRTGVADDLWWWNDIPAVLPRVYARDRLRRGTIPGGPGGQVLPGDVDAEVVVLGSWTANPAPNPAPLFPLDQPIGGSVLEENRGAWTSTKFNVADLLAAAQFPAVGAPGRAEAETTFAVVYAMSEPEMQGRFDIYNGWDRARMSFGLCHWTLAGSTRHQDVNVIGELASILAWYRDRDPAGFATGLGSWGLDVDAFAALAPGGPGIRNGPVKVWGLSPAIPERSAPIPRTEVALTEWLRSWRSIFRLLWVLRADRKLMPAMWGIMPAMWGLARWRISGVLAGRWSPDPALNTDIVDAAGRPATYGEILTSEAAVAALMRWHINLPARVFPPGAAGTTVQDAIHGAANLAGVPLPTPAAALAANPAFAAAVVTTLTDVSREDHPAHPTVVALRAVNAMIPDLGRRVDRAAGSFHFWAEHI